MVMLCRRFDVHIHVEFPDEKAREQIVMDTLEKIPLNYAQDPLLSDAHAVAAYVAKHTGGKSAGDVRALLREAAMASMRERIDATSVAIKFVRHAVESGGGDLLTSSQQQNRQVSTPAERPKIPSMRDRRGRR